MLRPYVIILLRYYVITLFFWWVMKKIFFVAGTDTSIGKTTVAVQLLRHYNKLNYSTVGLKPVASGCEKTPAGLRNEDALLLQDAASIKLPYEQVNPITFEPPIAPHIAAQLAGEPLSVKRLTAACQHGLDRLADVTIIEGAGGWLVPLNQKENISDFVSHHQFPTILVVGMRLGCLNHALLTVESIKASGVPLAGWIANHIDPDMEAQKDNLETLKQRIDAPLWATNPFEQVPHTASILELLS
jgi:dethiobiotin synthetase